MVIEDEDGRALKFRTRTRAEYARVRPGNGCGGDPGENENRGIESRRLFIAVGARRARCRFFDFTLIYLGKVEWVQERPSRVLGWGAAEAAAAQSGGESAGRAY